MSKLSYFLLESKNKELLLGWLDKDHIKKYLFGQGLENTLKDIDLFLGNKDSIFQHWIAYIDGVPFGYLMTSEIKMPNDEYAKWIDEGEAITLDVFIGEEKYLGKGLSVPMIRELLLSQFSHISQVLIDPDSKNLKAIHVYEKVGFKKLEKYTPSWNPVQHWIMKLKMNDLKSQVRKSRV